MGDGELKAIARFRIVSEDVGDEGAKNEQEK